MSTLHFNYISEEYYSQAMDKVNTVFNLQTNLCTQCVHNSTISIPPTGFSNITIIRD